jgi:hypothetical protein
MVSEVADNLHKIYPEQPELQIEADLYRLCEKSCRDKAKMADMFSKEISQ